jgi:hypothetical protein
MLLAWAQDCLRGHKKHHFTLAANDHPLVRELPMQSPNGRKLNERIISISSDFIAATNLSHSQAAFPAIPDLIIKFMQFRAFRPSEELRRIVDIEP